MRTKAVILGSLALSIYLTAAQPVLAQTNLLKFRCASNTDTSKPQLAIQMGEQQVVWGTEVYQNLKQNNNSDQSTRSYILSSANEGVVTIELKMLQGLSGNLRYSIEETGTRKILADFGYVCIRDLN